MLRNILYVRTLDGEVTELLYPLNWPTTEGFRYYALARATGECTEPAFRQVEFVGNYEGQIGEKSGKMIKFERATEEILTELLNNWTTNHLIYSNIEDWYKRIEKFCINLVEPDKQRLKEIGMKSKYWK
jgi:hypothetical protein